MKSQVFLSKSFNGFSLGGMVERYQNFFQSTNPDGSLSNPPTFDSIRILHTPSVDASSVDRRLAHTPFEWSFDASIAGLSRSEPGFHTSSLLGRFDFSPEISLPLHFDGWSVRPALDLHETYYTERFVDGVAVNNATNRQAVETSVEIRPPALEKIFDGEFLGQKWKHVIEPRVVYRYVNGVNDLANVLQFDERDILSDTHEVEYGFVTRLYAKRPPSSIQECETPMTGLAVGAAAPEQRVPWQRISNLENQTCSPGPAAREVLTWEVAQKYFLDPTFGGALVPGQRNVFATTEDLTGIAFITQPRHLSPLVSRLRVATGSHTDTEWDMDYDFQLSRINASTLLVNYNVGPFTLGGGDAFLQIPQTTISSPSLSEGTCAPSGEHQSGNLQVQSVSSGPGLRRPDAERIERGQQFRYRLRNRAIAVRHRANDLQLGLLRRDAGIPALCDRQCAQREPFSLYVQPREHWLLWKPEETGTSLLKLASYGERWYHSGYAVVRTRNLRKGGLLKGGTQPIGAGSDRLFGRRRFCLSRLGSSSHARRSHAGGNRRLSESGAHSTCRRSGLCPRARNSSGGDFYFGA